MSDARMALRLRFLRASSKARSTSSTLARTASVAPANVRSASLPLALAAAP
jgi:hypothetical protein